MIMMLCGFAAYMTHIGAMIWWSSWRQNHCSILTPLTCDDCRLFCRLSDVSGRLFRNRLGVLLMATLFPVMVNVGISVAQLLPFVPPRRRLFSHRLQGCGAGGASFRNVAD